MKKVLSILIAVLTATSIIMSGCGNSNNSGQSKVSSDQEYAEAESEQTTPEPTTKETDPPTTAEPELSETCDMVLASGYDGDDYYELVANKVDSYPSTKYSFGVIKNNKWLVEMSEKCPFINEDGWWKGRDSSSDTNYPCTFEYMGSGCFYYDANPEIVYKPETGVSFEVSNFRSYSPYHNEGDPVDYSRLMNDNCEIIVPLWGDQHAISYINMNTGESKTTSLRLHNLANNIKIGLLSDGLFYAFEPSSFSSDSFRGFYDLEGNQIINLMDYKPVDLMDLGDYMFYNGEYTIKARNDANVIFNLTYNTKGEIIKQEKAE